MSPLGPAEHITSPRPVVYPSAGLSACAWIAVFLIWGLGLFGCAGDPEPVSQTVADNPAVDEVRADTFEEPSSPDGLLELADFLGIEAGDTAVVPDEGSFPNDFLPIAHTEPTASPGGHPDVFAALGPGEVRAGIILGPETTFGGQDTDCRPGDFKIYNSRVQFCIANEVSITSMLYGGGQLIDADFVGQQNDRLFAVGVHNQFIIGSADLVDVLSDGGDGTAVVRTIGPDMPLKIIDDYAGRLLQPQGVSIETEYRLQPDVDYLEVVTWLSPRDRDLGTTAGDMGFMGDTTRLFYPGFGRDRPASGTAFEFMAGTAEARTYAIYSGEDFSNYPLDLSDLIDFPLVVSTLSVGRIPRGEEGAFRRYFILGDGGTDSVRRRIAEISGEPVPAQSLRVHVTDGVGAGREGISLVVRDVEGSPRDLLYTDPFGSTELELPSGEYTVEVESWVGGLPEVATARVEDTTGADLDIVLPDVGRVAFRVDATDSAGGTPTPSPAKVDMWGPADYRFLVPRGELEAEVLPGTYTVAISRGEAFSHVLLDGVEIAAEPTINALVEAQLERLWQTDGLISGEFHQHCTRSFDSVVSERDRVLSNIVEGVDFVVPTDHDVVTDFDPVIEALAAEDLIYAMPSTEVSPSFVHLGALPMVYDPLAPSGGGFSFGKLDDEGDVVHLMFPEILQELRADWGVEVVQVNHPRDNSALFITAGYDPLVGPSGLSSAVFSTDFDTVEVFNGRGQFCQVMDDWLSLVARGYPIAGVGNSDTHSLSTEAGYPRNYLPSTASSAEEINDDDILQGLLSGNVSVSGGALVTYPGGPEIGSTVIVEGDEWELPVRVQTPQWGQIDQVLVIVNGDIVQEIDVDLPLDEIVSLDERLRIDVPEEDAYLLVFAYGDTAMTVVTPGEAPFGFSNPIFLDVDGVDGWSPPGIDSEDDLLGLSLPWCD